VNQCAKIATPLRMCIVFLSFIADFFSNMLAVQNLLSRRGKIIIEMQTQIFMIQTATFALCKGVSVFFFQNCVLIMKNWHFITPTFVSMIILNLLMQKTPRLCTN